MNVTDYMSPNVFQTLGWTLLHTIWQGGLIYLFLQLVLRNTDQKKSSLRYFAGVAAISILMVFVVTTYIYLLPDTAKPVTGIAFSTGSEFTTFYPSNTSESSLLDHITRWINGHMDIFLIIWSAGVGLFFTRFLGGLFYIHQLRKHATEVDVNWNKKLSHLAAKLGVKKLVSLAQSHRIYKPVVIGHLKPMIILPVGLLTGLPAEQLEAIFVHELTHIRRHDFLINILQALVEMMLFFNPFVWLISDCIRKEREHCCDDQVVALLNPVHYAMALAHLEELNLRSTSPLVLGLDGNKFYLFNRIKRIMEKSVNPQNNRVKPMALLVLIAVGFACASWLSIGTSEDAPLSNRSADVSTETVAPVVPVPTDTTKDKADDEVKSGSYSRTEITTYDEEGKPHTEITEEYDGDEDLKLLFSGPGSRRYSGFPDMPAIPPIPSIPAIPAIPAMPAFPMEPLLRSYSYTVEGDTLPGLVFRWSDSEDWEEFGEQMRQRFEHFEDNEEFAQAMEEWSEKMSEWGENFAHRFGDDFHMDMERLNERLDNLPHHDFDFKRFEEKMNRLKDELKEQELKFEKFEMDLEKFENELTDQLVKDGYLEKGEDINSLNWHGDRSITVNGKKIDDKDVQKYEAINKKYFGERKIYRKD